MKFEDWRDASAEQVAPLYGSESLRWLSALGWDLAPSWRIVEEARIAGRLPGLIVRRAGGTPIGWAFYLLHEGTLQIGGLVGDTAAAVRGLLGRILQSPEAGLARGFSCFLFPASPSLQSALERHRFFVARHLYLSRPLGEGDAGAVDALPGDLRMRPLGEADPADVVRLLARAYAGRPEARCFAPDARLEQWAHYVGQLLGTPAVGRYLPAASFVVEQKERLHPLAVIITTSLSPATAHIAQIVVDPGTRRSGLGQRLVQQACASARSAGHERMTLIVAESNGPASTLYFKNGFETAAHFLYATRPVLSRRLAAPAPPLAAARG
jgi:ribosomal protein S18 acetylase RimI-like enzyme